MKYVPERTFRELLRLADTLRDAPSYERAREIHEILYAIARQQHPKARGVQGPIEVSDPADPGLTLE